MVFFCANKHCSIIVINRDPEFETGITIFGFFRHHLAASAESSKTFFFLERNPRPKFIETCESTVDVFFLGCVTPPSMRRNQNH